MKVFSSDSLFYNFIWICRIKNYFSNGLILISKAIIKIITFFMIDCIIIDLLQYKKSISLLFRPTFFVCLL